MVRDGQGTKHSQNGKAGGKEGQDAPRCMHLWKLEQGISAWGQRSLRGESRAHTGGLPPGGLVRMKERRRHGL